MPTRNAGSTDSRRAHLPQPPWFARYAVDAEAGDAGSTLAFYRAALARRRELLGGEGLEFLDSPDGVVVFARPGGWVCATNFTSSAVPLPAGEVVLSSSGDPSGAGLTELPGETTVWVQRAG